LEFERAITLVREVQNYDRRVEEDRRFADDPIRRNARALHLRVKGDLARALLYVLAPGARILEVLPPRPDALLPALWFAPLLAHGQWYRLELYSLDGLRLLLSHTTDPRRFREPLGSWLESWAAGLADSERRGLVRRFLA